ncbi:MAG TPA: PAS domain S-box protein [Opitutus sp.]|nr:PAS domain S-box protein [Opitutus sp.]
MTDFQTLFHSTPDAYLIVRAEEPFTITAVNDAYLRATMTRRDQILGQPLFEVFPDNPATPAILSGRVLRDSLDQVVATRCRHEMPPTRYDIRRPAADGGAFEERFWRVCNIPLPGPSGAIAHILHRVEDVTAMVHLQHSEQQSALLNETLRRQADAAQEEVASRSQELAATHRELEEHRELLHETRLRLDAAISAGDVATFTWEPEVDRVRADDNLRRWFNLAPDRAHSGPLADYLAAVHPQDAPGLRRTIARSLAGDLQPEAEFRLRHGDGWRHVLARARVEVDARGRPARFVGVLIDITELRQTSAALAIAREELHLAAEAAELGTFFFDLQSGRAVLNARCKTHHGLNDDAASESLELFYASVHPDHRGDVRRTVENAIYHGTPFDVEYRTLSTAGQVRWIHARGRAHSPGDDGFHRFEGITIDVSGQKAIEANLIESEARYRLVVESLHDHAIFMLNDAGIITHWNAGAEKLLGYTADEILGQHSAILFTPEDRARGEPEKELVTAKEKGRANDDRWHLRKDGSRFFVTGLMSALTDAQGRRIGMAKIMRDITDRHAAAAERERLLESERAARAEAERTSRLKDDFLATLSHELRTPLNAILGWTQVLKEGGLDPELMAEGLEIIDRNTHVQAQLIEDLLDMSRIISGKVRLNAQRVDLSTVIDAAIDSVRAAADAKHIHIDIKGRTGAAVVLGDRTRLQQIAWNLLSNAIKFTPARGRVEVCVSADDRTATLRVRDNGAGISPDFLPHVFERFRQADASTTRTHGGLGLGLSIVKQLAELHGGEVRAESAGLGRGSEFVVSFPLRAPPRHSENTGHTASPTSPPPASRDVDLRGLKVLVVEDEPDSANLVKRVLESHHAQVVAAGSVPAALAVFGDFAPDLVLSDIGMPHHDGYELMRRVRALPGGAEVPAAALTALARREDVDRALAAGFHTHLAKPVKPAELLALVASLSGRQPPSPP